jgi:Ca2+-binding RTX toxin-like protein
MISGATGANMNGAAGDDSIIGGTGGDTITGGEGRDSITSGAGDDTINVSSQAADGNDLIDGGTGVDTIAVAAGTAFTFSTNNAQLQNVEVVALGSGSSVTLTGQGGAAEAFTINGGGGAETIVAGAGDDTINGRLGDDVITGAEGADSIDGGAGVDTTSYADINIATSHGLADLFGIAVNLTDAAIAESGTNDDIEEILDTVGTNEDYELGQTGSTELEAGTAQYISDTKGDAYSIDTLVNVEGVIGSDLTDFIALGAGGMSADGGRGNDAIFGGNGADTMVGGLGDDVFFIANDSDHAAGEIITGGGGTDVIRFTSVEAGTLVLTAGVTGVEEVALVDNVGGATATAESIDASALTAGITLTGNGAINTLTGSAFNDEIDGGAGADIINGGAGDDALTVDDTDVIDGGDGTDTATFAANVDETVMLDADLVGVENIEAGAGSLDIDLSVQTEGFTITGFDAPNSEDTLTGGSGNDVINGLDDDDELFGGAGADTIDGGDGDDTINGGEGNDSLTGGADADVFDFTDNPGTDTITDFLANTDYLDFDNMTAGTDGTASGIGAFADATDLAANDAAHAIGQGEILVFASYARKLVMG